MADVVVVTDDGDPVEEVAEVIPEVVEAIAEVIPEVVEAAVEATPTAAPAGYSEEEVQRILAVENRLRELESRPWPMEAPTVAAIAEESAISAVAPVVDALVAAAEEPAPVASDDEVTIVQPDVEQKKESWFKRIW